MDTSPTMPEKPEKTDAKSVILKRPKPEKLTPCGYPAGGMRASDGTRYVVLPSGQIVRQGPPKLGKAELKRHKKAKRRPKS